MSDYGTPPPPPEGAPPPPPPEGFPPPGSGGAPSGAPLASWIQRVGASVADFALILPFVTLRFIFASKISQGVPARPRAHR